MQNYCRKTVQNEKQQQQGTVVKQEAQEEQAEYERVSISCGPTTRLANASSLQGSHFELIEPSRITGDDVESIT